MAEAGARSQVQFDPTLSRTVQSGSASRIREVQDSILVTTGKLIETIAFLENAVDLVLRPDLQTVPGPESKIGPPPDENSSLFSMLADHDRELRRLVERIADVTGRVQL